MSAYDPTDDEAIRRSWVKQIAIGAVRVTQHAHQEMAEEAISYEDVLHAISSGDILENYPDTAEARAASFMERPSKDGHSMSFAPQPSRS